MKLIDKDKIAAELEKRRKSNSKNKLNLPAAFEDNYLLSLLDTLETKEVDLEKECKIYLKNNFASKEAPDEFLTTQMQLDDMVLFAKHFYELGLNKGKGE